MKRNVVVILGLYAVVGSGCGREADERFRPDRFVHATEPEHTGPLPVSAPTSASELGPSSSSSPGSSPGPSAARQATAAHGASAAVRAQMLEIKEENAGTDVLEDVKTALREGMTPELTQLASEGARVFDEWVSALQTGRYHISRLRLSRDAQFDRVEKVDRNGRQKIRRYDVAFGGPEFVGWIEVKRTGARWIIVDAGSYAAPLDPVDERDPVLDWFTE